MREHEPDELETTTSVQVGLSANVWFPVSANLQRTWTKRYKDRSDEFKRTAESASGLERPEVAERIADDERLGDAYVSAGEKASQTADAQFRRTLARVVAAGLHDDAKIDQATYLVSVLTKLEPIHIRMLDLISRVTHGPKQADRTPMASMKGIAGIFGITPAMALSIGETLHAHSLVTDRRDGDMQNWSAAPDGAFAVTPFGDEVLEYARELESGEAIASGAPRCGAVPPSDLASADLFRGPCILAPHHKGSLHKTVTAGLPFRWTEVTAMQTDQS